MGLFSNKVKRNELNPGDHIYRWQKIATYSHHGIYIGNDQVIHFTSAVKGNVINVCPRYRHISPESGVVMSCLDCFAWGKSIRRYEYNTSCLGCEVCTRGTSTCAESKPAAEVVSRAKKFLANGYPDYNVVTNNCEHFALCCKTGSKEAHGGQAEFIADKLTKFGIVIGAILVIFIIAIA